MPDEEKIKKLSAMWQEATMRADGLQQMINTLRMRISELESAGSGAELTRLQNELEAIRYTTALTARAFDEWIAAMNISENTPIKLPGYNIESIKDMSDAVAEGIVTYTTAISQVKAQLPHLLADTYSNSGGIDPQIIQNVLASLNSLSDKLADIQTRISKIETDGVKTSGEVSSSGGSVAQVLQEIDTATKNMSEDTRSAYEQLSKLLQTMIEFSNLDVTKVHNILETLRSVNGIGQGEFSTQSVENIAKLIERLQHISAQGSGISFYISGLNDLKVSKASLKNLVEFLPLLATINSDKINELGKVDLSNWANLKVSKSTLKNLVEYLEPFSQSINVSRLQELSNIDLSNLSSLSSLKISEATVKNLTDLMSATTQNTSAGTYQSQLNDMMQAIGQISASTGTLSNNLANTMNQINVSVNGVIQAVNDVSANISLATNGISTNLTQITDSVNGLVSAGNQASTSVANATNNISNTTGAAAEETVENVERIKQAYFNFNIDASISSVVDAYEKLSGTGHAHLSSIRKDIGTIQAAYDELGNAIISNDEDKIAGSYQIIQQHLVTVRNMLRVVRDETNMDFKISFDLDTYKSSSKIEKIREDYKTLASASSQLQDNIAKMNDYFGKVENAKTEEEKVAAYKNLVDLIPTVTRMLRDEINAEKELQKATYAENRFNFLADIGTLSNKVQQVMALQRELANSSKMSDTLNNNLYNLYLAEKTYTNDNAPLETRKLAYQEIKDLIPAITGELRGLISAESQASDIANKLDRLDNAILRGDKKFDIDAVQSDYQKLNTVTSTLKDNMTALREAYNKMSNISYSGAERLRFEQEYRDLLPIVTDQIKKQTVAQNNWEQAISKIDRVRQLDEELRNIGLNARNAGYDLDKLFGNQNWLKSTSVSTSVKSDAYEQIQKFDVNKTISDLEKVLSKHKEIIATIHEIEYAVGEGGSGKIEASIGKAWASYYNLLPVGSDIEMNNIVTNLRYIDTLLADIRTNPKSTSSDLETMMSAYSRLEQILEHVNNSLSMVRSQTNIRSDYDSAISTGKYTEDIEKLVNLYQKLKNPDQTLTDNVNKLKTAFDEMYNSSLMFSERYKAYTMIKQNLGTVTHRVTERLKLEEQAEKSAAAASNTNANTIVARNTALQKAQNLLVQVDRAERNWTKAKMGKSSNEYANLAGYNSQLRELINQLTNGSISVDEFNTKLSNVKTNFNTSATAIRLAGENAKDLKSQFGAISSTLSMWFSTTRIIMTVYSNIRKLISASIELDKSLNQLQIVTKESDSVMRAFGDTAAKTASQIGSSVTDFLNSATTYARLGYSLSESSKLAEYTAMLQNVGDIDVSQAQDAVTSIVKAFNIDVSSIQSVMDKLVVTGNNFPISVSQIAEGMTNASSTLAAAGNSFEQSVALLTAANTTIQDASKSSTGLRTIAARIRNTKTELDDLGEVVSESDYDKLIKQLTKLNIALVDNGEYRSTYDILSDIASKWDEMSSMEQASLAETLAGTRQQSVLYGIINQFKEASGAMDAMSNSAGELEKSYATHMNSAEAHVNQFKASFQKFGADLFNGTEIKFFVDLGKHILNIASALQKIHLLLPTITASMLAIKALRSWISKQRSLSVVNEISRTAIALTNENASMASLTQTVGQLDFAKQKLLVVELQQAVLEGEIQEEEKAQIVTALGLTAADGALTTANTGLAASFKTLMASIPVWGWIALGISVVIPIVGKIAEAVTESDDKIHTLSEDIQQIASDMKQVSDEYQSFQQSADSTIPRFVQLAKGVNNLGENVSLTTEEYAEFLTLNNKIAELFPELNLGMDTNGNAMLSLSYNADTLAQSLYDLVEAQRQLTYQNLADKIPDILDKLKDVRETIKNEKETEMSLIGGSYPGLEEKYNKLYSDKTSQIYRELRPAAMALIQTNSDYQVLSKESQKIVQAIVSGLDFGSIDISDKDDLETYLNENILSPLKTLDFSQIHELQTQLKQGEISERQFVDKTKSIFSEWKQSLTHRPTSGDWSGSWLSQSASLFEDALGKMGYNGTTYDDTLSQFINDLGGIHNAAEPAAKTVAKLSDATENLKSGYDALSKAQKEMNSGVGLSSDTIQSLAKVTENYTDCLYEENGVLKLNTQAWKDLINKQLNDSIEALETQGKDLIKKRNALLSELVELSKSWWPSREEKARSTEIKNELAIINESIKENKSQVDIYKRAIDDAAESTVIFTGAMSSFGEKLDEIQKVFTTVKEVIKDYSDRKILSIDSAQKLLSLGDEYINYLFDENGHLAINEAAYEKLTKAKINMMKAELLRNTLDIINNIKTEADAVDYLKNKTIQGTKATNDYNEALLRQAYLEKMSSSSSKIQEAVKYAYDTFNNYLKILNNVNTSYKANEESETSVTKGLEDQKDALEKQKDALDKTKTALDKQKQALEDNKNALSDLNSELEKDKGYLEDLISLTVDMLKKKYENEKETIENLKKAYKDRVDALKDSLDEEKDAYDRYKSYTDKNKNISILEQRASALQGTKSVEGIQRLVEINKELSEKQQELYDEQYSNSVDDHKDALDKEYEYREKLWDKETSRIDELLKNERKLRVQAMELIDAKTQSFYNDLWNYVYMYTTKSRFEFQNLWDKAYEVLDKYNWGQLTCLQIMDLLEQRIYDNKTAIEGLDREIKNINTSLDTTSREIDKIAESTTNLDDKINQLKESYEKALKTQEEFNSGHEQPQGLKNYKIRIHGVEYTATGFPDKKSAGEAIYKKLATNTVGNPSEKLKDIISGLQEYASGTLYSKKGLSIVDEEGVGSEFILKKGRLDYLPEGSVVFNQQETHSLKSLAKINSKVLDLISNPFNARSFYNYIKNGANPITPQLSSSFNNMNGMRPANNINMPMTFNISNANNLNETKLADKITNKVFREIGKYTAWYG